MFMFPFRVEDAAKIIMIKRTAFRICFQQANGVANFIQEFLTQAGAL